jgi:hypothetical protein
MKEHKGLARSHPQHGGILPRSPLQGGGQVEDGLHARQCADGLIRGQELRMVERAPCEASGAVQSDEGHRHGRELAEE